MKYSTLRNLSALTLILFIAALLACGGCSPSINAWVARGTQGLANAQANQTAWYQAEIASLNKARNSSINACYTDTINAFQNGVATSQPTVTKPVTAQWVNDQRNILLATMTNYDLEKSDLDVKYMTAIANLNSVQECFSQIQRLNVAYATTSDQLAAEVNNLAQIVSQLQAAKTTPTGK
jgi:hypothetical protein